jgi:hypothetical protein
LNLDLVARAPEFTVNHVADLYNFDLPGFDNPEIKKFEDIGKIVKNELQNIA